MQLKLDENLGHRGQALISEAGYDVSSVSIQKVDSLLGKLWIVSKTQIREYAPVKE